MKLETKSFIRSFVIAFFVGFSLLGVDFLMDSFDPFIAIAFWLLDPFLSGEAWEIVLRILVLCLIIYGISRIREKRARAIAIFILNFLLVFFVISLALFIFVISRVGSWVGDW